MLTLCSAGFHGWWKVSNNASFCYLSQKAPLLISGSLSLTWLAGTSGLFSQPQGAKVKKAASRLPMWTSLVPCPNINSLVWKGPYIGRACQPPCTSLWLVLEISEAGFVTSCSFLCATLCNSQECLAWPLLSKQCQVILAKPARTPAKDTG